MNQKSYIRDLRTKKKFSLDDEYVNGYAKNLDPYATAVYLSLCRHANKTQSCFPGIETIAEQHNISERTVMRKLALLIEHNLVFRRRNRAEDGTFVSNTYFLIDKGYWGKPVEISVDKLLKSTQPGDSEYTRSICNESHPKDTHIPKEEEKEINKEKENFSPLKQKIKKLKEKMSFVSPEERTKASEEAAAGIRRARRK